MDDRELAGRLEAIEKKVDFILDIFTELDDDNLENEEKKDGLEDKK